MSEHQLSTRELAGTSDEGTAAESTNEPADEPTARERDEVETQEPLLPADQSGSFNERWHDIQASFVDRPRDAVADADALVAELMQRLATEFSQERERLEAQWDRGDDVSTEDLRVALTRYRSFFGRLLTA